MNPWPAIVLTGVAAVAAALPSSASATSFCVGAPAGCSGVAVNAADLEAGALAAAQLGDGQPDEIVIAAGTYTETADGTWTLGPGSDAVTIRGAGMGQTTLGSAGTGNQLVLDLGGSGTHPVTVRDLTVSIPASFADMGGYGGGLVIRGGLLERVQVTSANPRAGGITTEGVTTVRDVEVDTPHGKALTVSAGTVASVESSTLRGREGVWTGAGATTSVRRSAIEVTTSAIGGSGSGLANAGGAVTASDTLITLTGAVANLASGLSATAYASDSATSVSHVTIVKAGGTSTLGVSNGVGSGQPGNSVVTISNSIVRGVDIAGSTHSPAGDGAPITTVRASNSAPLDPPLGDALVNESEGVQNADPQFVAPATGNYRLAEGSPSIDTANPAYTTQPLDRDGGARVQDGDDDGVAVPDQGAYERPDPTPPVAEAPPPSAPTGPATPASLASAQTGCKVPKLKGLSAKKAKRRLVRAACRVGRVGKPRRLGGRPKLVVRRQSVKAGKVVPRGTKIRLRLGRKTKPGGRRG